ncbi:hypothetical protein V495_00094 [Pseudogymnoascus sp. VKM F-4514 (FW-929)]|nr:hypothetical protein V495_00094 [Pseudogymnoascus sp. VKM F-4514 (FW-929)]KFY67718.1 hypothetical protein V497_00250 [Pseudogymnoascus sp. VKM F-4516 (FW-969)]
MEPSKGVNMALRIANTGEVRQGNYTPDAIDAIDTITTKIKKHPKAALRIFELTWKGMIREGQLTGAVSFLNHLGSRLDEEDFDTVLLSLRDMYGNVQETSWDAWAAAFTAADFLHEIYRNDDTLEMTRRIQHGAVAKWQQIMGQSTSNGQWSNAYLVLKRLQRHYKREKRCARKWHREGKKGYNLHYVERMKKSNDDLAEVLHATLNLAVQKRQWVEASHQVLELVELNADVRDLVRILEEICSGAISENRWQDATETVRAFKNIPAYKKVAAKSLGRLRRQWYEADGIRWATGNAADLKVVAKRKRLGESPIRDDKLLPKKQCLADNLSLLPAELKSQVFLEISDRETLLNFSQVSKVFRGVFDSRKKEFFFSTYAREFRNGELTYEDAARAITKHIKGEPKGALMLFEATWKSLFYINIEQAEFFKKVLRRKLDTEDYDTLLLSLFTIYDHVILETSWGAWAGALAATKHLRRHSDKGEILSIRMEQWILRQFALRQQEIIGQGVLQLQEETALFILYDLCRYHEIQRCREEKRHLEWKHLERKKKHIDNLAEVLQTIVHLELKPIQHHERVDIYRLIADFMLLENQAGRHADFHGGVQCICDPSTCRHTADADDLFRVLEEICTKLISENNEEKAYGAIRVFERMPPYYKHIAKERHRRVRSMFIDRWGDLFDESSEDESGDESEEGRERGRE